jgi:hypothetical protein
MTGYGSLRSDLLNLDTSSNCVESRANPAQVSFGVGRPSAASFLVSGQTGSARALPQLEGDSSDESSD